MISFKLEEEQEIAREALRDFAGEAMRPIARECDEASAIPEEGGAYRWYRAFLSPFWSFQFSCLDWLTWILDAAIYPALRAAEKLNAAS